MFEYYLVTKPRFGFYRYDGHTAPIDDVFITNDYDAANSVYCSLYGEHNGCPCKICVPYDGRTEIQMQNYIYNKYRYCKKMKDHDIELKVKTSWL